MLFNFIIEDFSLPAILLVKSATKKGLSNKLRNMRDVYKIVFI